MSPRSKKILFSLARFTLPVVIIGWLVYSVDREQLAQLWAQPKDWLRLAAGFAIVTAACCISFYRWYLLVRALDIPFRVRDAFRLSFIAYLFNFVGAGSVGGDLFKAIFIARENPRRRTEAVATLVVDRVIGVYALLLVTSVAILAGDISDADEFVRGICNFTLVVAAIAYGMLPVFMIPRFGHGPFVRAMVNVPRVGPIFARLMLAFHAYRSKRLFLLLVGMISVSIHVLLVVAVYVFATAILEQPPSLGRHMIIVPLSLVAGSLPFTPGGIGTFEAAMQVLYKLIGGSTEASGLFVALVYRLTTFGIAGIGVLYYWLSRREMGEMMKEAEREEAEDQTCESEHARLQGQPASVVDSSPGL